MGTLDGRHHAGIQTVDMSGGAASWRRTHPHPVFSADGRRQSFNSGSGEWNRLRVAEIGQ